MNDRSDDLGILVEEVTYTQFGAQGAVLGNAEASLRANPAITPATITLAKITPGGTNGSITVNAEGIVTGYVAPT